MTQKPVENDMVTWERPRVCPDCGCKEFYEGPRGGRCMNTRCKGCGSWFNICALFGDDMVIQRIGPKPFLDASMPVNPSLRRDNGG